MKKSFRYFFAWKRKLIRISTNFRDLARQIIVERSLERVIDENFSPIFLCGISGSGTTLLSGLLEQFYENDISLRESDRHTNTDYLLWMDRTETFKSLADYFEAISIPATISIRKIRRAKLRLYRSLANYPKKTSVVFDKAPNSHLRRIGKLLLAFPNGKAVLIFRDPIEVIEGLQRKWPIPFGKTSVEELAKFWLHLHIEFLSQFSAGDKRLIIISYQELVDESDLVLGKIAKQLNLQKNQRPKKLKDK